MYTGIIILIIIQHFDESLQPVSDKIYQINKCIIITFSNTNLNENPKAEDFEI
jgi:hypothetical protein